MVSFQNAMRKCFVKAWNLYWTFNLYRRKNSSMPPAVFLMHQVSVMPPSNLFSQVEWKTSIDPWVLLD